MANPDGEPNYPIPITEEYVRQIVREEMASIPEKEPTAQAKPVNTSIVPEWFKSYAEFVGLPGATYEDDWEIYKKFGPYPVATIDPKWIETPPK